MRTAGRIQRRRTKGWRMPEGAVYVGRPSRWGNPFMVVNGGRQGWLIYDDRPESRGGGYIAAYMVKDDALAHVVRLYRKSLFRQMDMTSLAGRDLACWCPLDQPCHADVLLEFANGETS